MRVLWYAWNGPENFRRPENREKKVLVIGVIGADVHAVGNKILYHAFTEAGFEKLCDKLNKLPYGKMQDIYRFLSNSAVFAELDASGRVLIPAELRAFAGIENEAHIVGMRSNIEIWSPENWGKEQESFSLEGFAPVIDELGFSFGE